MHMTGRYPDWWVGRRYDRAVRWLAGSESAELGRKGVQRLLLGNPENKDEWGTGALPKSSIVGWSMRQGVADCVASITVRSDRGGISSIQLLSYDQGRTKWQSDTVDGVWLDEECDEDVYSEAKTRTNIGLGPVYLTATPMKGMTKVVRRFWLDRAENTCCITMGIEDADHYTDAERAVIINSYEEHEREARAHGIPLLGSGRVFVEVGRKDISIPAFDIPLHWRQICGIDFGWDHPSAAARLAHDCDTDSIYVTAVHRQSKQTPLLFAATVKPWGDWLPWAWPHDGKQSGGKFDQQDQAQLQAIYAGHGLKMLELHAQCEDGTNGVNATVQDMLDRMRTGRWKVFSHLGDWFDEFDSYHRKDGMIVKEHDDAISASRYGFMMRRFAITKPAPFSMKGFASRFGGDF